MHPHTRYRRPRDTAQLDARQRTDSDIAHYVQEAVTRRLVEDVIEEVHEVRDRITALLFAVLSGVALEVLTRTHGG